MDDSIPALFDLQPENPAPMLHAADFPFYHGAKSLASHGFIDESWVPVLQQADPELQQLAQALAARSAAGEQVLPAPDVTFRALTLPFEQVKVLIIGQDPYPTVGHANGLAFAAARHVHPLPRSIANIYKELQSDLGLAPAAHADLGSWHLQGVLLLNQALTVAAGQAGAHQKLGWAPVVKSIISALNQRPQPPVALLWGKPAQKLAPLMDRMQIFASAHPSPLSASRGFFGSKPFSNINRHLSAQGQMPIDWTVR